MIGNKKILGIMVNFVSGVKELWFSFLMLFYFTKDSLYLLATDPKWEMMSEVCLKIAQRVEGRQYKGTRQPCTDID